MLSFLRRWRGLDRGRKFPLRKRWERLIWPMRWPLIIPRQGQAARIVYRRW